jgi:hypothetical protein
VKYTRRDLHEWSPNKIFAEDDLNTTRWGSIPNSEIEKFFFGKLDSEGPRSVDCFETFTHPSVDGPAFQNFLRYMSVQKLRTPKGLANVAMLSKSEQHSMTLMMLQRIQDIFCATWTECVRQISRADLYSHNFRSAATNSLSLSNTRTRVCVLSPRLRTSRARRLASRSGFTITSDFKLSLFELILNSALACESVGGKEYPMTTMCRARCNA